VTARAVALALCAAACASGPRKRPDAPAQSPYVARLAGDLREAGRRFADGGLAGREYLALSIDRAGKARRFHADAAWRAEAERGDRDADGVPDARDACETAPLQPTDERGCPLPPCDPRDPGCARPSADDDARTRELLEDALLMFNPACEGSPVPQTPEPLEWGRGTQTAAGRLEVVTHGFNLAVTEVTNQKPGCQLFYELEFRLDSTPPPGQPRLRYLSVAFDAASDLQPGDARRAVFGIPVGPPVSPGRDQLRQGLLLFEDVRWRVRAVNGAQAASPWSPMRAQGPAPAGVDG
jgi:hypothetical protein